MVHAVLFDIDGTLIDSVDLHAEAWREALQHFGFDLPFDRVRHLIGMGGDQLLPELLPKNIAESRGEEMQEYRTKLFKDKFLARVKPFPAVRPLFERILSEGMRIGLASSAQPEEMEAYKKIAGIGDLIHTETSSGDAEKSKPHPDIFHAALRHLGEISPEVVMVLGDTPYDAQAAGKAGLRTIGMLCGGFPEKELVQAGCIAVYRNPQDLLDRYDESPLSRG